MFTTDKDHFIGKDVNLVFLFLSLQVLFVLAEPCRILRDSLTQCLVSLSVSVTIAAALTALSLSISFNDAAAC